MFDSIISLLWDCISLMFIWLQNIFYSFGLDFQTLVVGFCVVSGLIFAVIYPFVGKYRRSKNG